MKLHPVGTAQQRDAIIVDVDGTLCDVRRIRGLVAGSRSGGRRRNFDAFHAASAGCPPFPRVVRAVEQAHETGLAIVVVTSREAKWAALTRRWLAEHTIPVDELAMRPNGDYRADDRVKARMLSRLLDSYRPLLAIDDRKDTASVWTRAGIPTVLVDERGRLGRIEPTAAAIDDRVGVALAR